MEGALMAEHWVKCHAALTKGAKRALPRATRFVFLELLLEARDLDGSVEIRMDLDLPAAVYDVIGGNLIEIAEALSALAAVGMIVVEALGDGRFITIPSWDRWNKIDSSTARVAKWRDKKRTEQTEPCVYFVQRSDGAIKIGFTDTLAIRLHALRADHGSLDVLATIPGGRDVEGQMRHRFREHRQGKRGEWFDPAPELLEHIRNCSGNVTGTGEESRGEEIREEERESAPVKAPGPAAPLSTNGARVLAQISSHRDLFASLAPAELAPFVGRIEREIGKLERAEVWQDLESEVDSWVSYARSKSEERAQTPTQLLGLVENLARTRCRERPGKARIERERRRDEQARATTWPDGKAKSPAALETHDLDAEIAEADRRLAVERAKVAAEPKADPRAMAALAARVVNGFKRGAA